MVTGTNEENMWILNAHKTEKLKGFRAAKEKRGQGDKGAGEGGQLLVLDSVGCSERQAGRGNRVTSGFGYVPSEMPT